MHIRLPTVPVDVGPNISRNVDAMPLLVRCLLASSVTLRHLARCTQGLTEYQPVISFLQCHGDPQAEGLLPRSLHSVSLATAESRDFVLLPKLSRKNGERKALNAALRDATKFPSFLRRYAIDSNRLPLSFRTSLCHSEGQNSFDVFVELGVHFVPEQGTSAHHRTAWSQHIVGHYSIEQNNISRKGRQYTQIGQSDKASKSKYHAGKSAECHCETSPKGRVENRAEEPPRGHTGQER